ncbi:gliding motility-associated C-terminal domain-containing protein [Bacteroidales bacterium AH-315-I05]|nr:gliding motility-associated C-terminal domain-containing protein [Bacteroidales bacterium AH-315-I05]
MFSKLINTPHQRFSLYFFLSLSFLFLQINLAKAQSCGTSTSSTTDTCYAGTGTATATPSAGSAPYTYDWFEDMMMMTPLNQSTQTVTGLTTGTYYVMVSGNGGSCFDMMPISVTVGDLGGGFTATLTQKDDSCYRGVGTATATPPGGGSTPYTYLWENGQTDSTATGLFAGMFMMMDSGWYTVTVTDNFGCRFIDSVEVDTANDLSSTYVSTDDSSCYTMMMMCCGMGTATMSPSGGVFPYYYDWGGLACSTSVNPATGLMAGTYAVTVQDSNYFDSGGMYGCKVVVNVVISSSGNELPMMISSTNDACFAGTGTGTADPTFCGMADPDSILYLWDSNANNQTAQTATGLNAGTYNVTVTNNDSFDTECFGVSTVATVTVAMDSSLVVSISSTDEHCGQDDGTATVTPIGGTFPYIYSWSNAQTDSTTTGLDNGSYTVTATDNNGCDTSVTVSVSETAAPTLSTSSANISCNGANDGTATATPSGGTTPYSYSWQGGQTTQTATGLAAGSYDVTVTDGGGCTVNSSATINEPAAFSLPTGSTNENCSQSDGTATITPSGATSPYTYLWDSNASNQTNSTATGLAANTYSVTVTDNNACDTVTSVTINGTTAPTVSSVNSTDVLCNGESTGIATVTPTGGTSPYTYSWSNSQTDSTATGLAANTYSVTVTDAGSCTTDTTVTITEPSAITYTTDSIIAGCGTSTGTATITISGGTVPYNYSWENSQTDSSATGLAAGTYSVTVTDGNSCTVIDSVEITTSSPPTLSSSSDSVSCNGGSDGTAIVTPLGGTSPYTYLWSNSQSDSTATALGAGSYSVTVTDNVGCADSTNVTVNEPLALLLSFSSNNENCGQGDGDATASVSGGTSPYSYNWSNGDNGTTADSLLAGTYYVTITDDNSCTVNDSVEVSGTTAPTVSVTANDVQCHNGSDGIATASPSGGTSPYTYNWNNGDNNSTADSLSSGAYIVTVTDDNGCTDTASITVSQPTAYSISSSSSDVTTCGGSDGLATVSVSGATSPYSYSWSNSQSDSTAMGLAGGSYSVTISDANNCDTTISFTIDEPTPPTVTTSTSDAICGLNGSAVANPSGGTLPYAYAWDDSNNQSTQTSTGLTPGIYTVILTDSLSCSDTATATVGDNTSLTITVSSDTSICAGDTVILTASGGSAYSWSTNDTTASISENPTSNITYIVTVTEGITCSESDSITVSIIALPTVSISGQTSVCVGSSTTLTASTTNASGLTWSTSSIDSSITVSPLSDANYSVTVTGTCGSSSDTTIVSVLSLPIANAGNDTLVDEDEIIQLNGSGGVSYSWSPITGLDNQNIANPTAIMEETTTYILTVVDSNGCTNIDTVVISVTPIPAYYFVPNIFSPNGDGQNDELKVEGKDLTDIHLRIFDRWGEMVFETLDQNTSWNGTYNGKEMNTAVFIYVFDATVDGQPIPTQQGTVTLMRYNEK